MKPPSLPLAAISLLLTGDVLGDSCPPTPSMSSGTHFKPITRQQVNIGKGLRVSGKVLSAGDCKPIAGARIAHWQAGENGRYQDRLRAWLPSQTDGGYTFETEWPAAMVPHLHFRVRADGYRPVSTQWIGDDKVDHIEFNIILQPE